MAKQYQRTDRIAVQIQEELADLIRTEVEVVQDALITVTGVHVARDLGYADVAISILGGVNHIVGDALLYNDPIKTAEAIKRLNDHKKHLRFSLAQRLKLRVIPELRFHVDDTFVKANRLLRLIEDSNKSLSE